MSTYLLPAMGFILAAVLLTSLSSFVLFIPYFTKALGIPSNELLYYGTLLFFGGMPFGKLIGRAFKLYRHTVAFTLTCVTIISVTIFMMPFVSSIAVLLLFRFIQGSATVLMEVFSVSYSYIYSKRARALASTISISGIPAGVAIGSSITYIFRGGVINSYMTMGALSVICVFPFLLLLNGRPVQPRVESSGTTYRRPATWALGFLWMTIAGFNLVMASILPAYVGTVNPTYIPAVMDVFGFWGAIATVLGGMIAYILYPRLNGDRSLVFVAMAGYLLSIPGFVIFFLGGGGTELILGMTLIMFETFSIPAIYALPRRLYEDGMVAKGTWEFGLMGSLGHIIAPLMVIPLAVLFGYNEIFLFLMAFPIAGSIVMAYIPRLFR